MSTEIATVETTALVSHRAATNAAGLCRELVVKTAMKIGGRRYVQVEGWQAIANAFGCVASARNVEKVEGGYRATGQVVRISDGTVLAEAEGFVGDDESTWAKRPVFARRAMAQTRAMSRACRSAFAFVVTLMDAGLETTPAEEMSHVSETEPVVVRPKFNVEPKADRPGVVTLSPKVEITPTDDAVTRAKLAINKADTVDALDALRRLIDTRAGEGVFTADQAKDLIEMCLERAEFVGSGSEVAT